MFWIIDFSVGVMLLTISIHIVYMLSTGRFYTGYRIAEKNSSPFFYRVALAANILMLFWLFGMLVSFHLKLKI